LECELALFDGEAYLKNDSKVIEMGILLEQVANGTGASKLEVAQVVNEIHGQLPQDLHKTRRGILQDLNYSLTTKLDLYQLGGAYLGLLEIGSPVFLPNGTLDWSNVTFPDS